MKRLFGALLLCGFLAASFAQAAIPPKAPKGKVAHKHAKKAKKNAKPRKAVKAHKAPLQKSN